MGVCFKARRQAARGGTAQRRQPACRAAVAAQRVRADAQHAAQKQWRALIARWISWRGRSAETISAVACRGRREGGKGRQGWGLLAATALGQLAAADSRTQDHSEAAFLAATPLAAPPTASMRGSSSRPSAPRSSSSACTVRSGRTHLHGVGGGGRAGVVRGAGAEAQTHGAMQQHAPTRAVSSRQQAASASPSFSGRKKRRT